MTQQSRFTLQLQEFAETVGRRRGELLRQVALEVFRRVVLRSPVDTGRFRASWQLVIEGQVIFEQARLAVPEISKRPFATAVVGAYTVGAGQALIFNPTPYGRRLEFGWSDQAPYGMVRLTLVEIDSILRTATNAARRSESRTTQ